MDDRCCRLKRRYVGVQICPKCGRNFNRLLAVSREDNKTMICDNCGIIEALNSLPPNMLASQERTWKGDHNEPRFKSTV